MSRYVIPSVTIPALYSAYRSYFYGSDEKAPVRTIENAVTQLNKNENVEEAVRFLYSFNETHSHLKTLTPAASAMLALRGCDVCRYIPVKQVNVERFEKFEDVLATFHLGNEWNAAIAWINRVACSEEDLACPEEWLVRRPSQIERLHQLLQIMFLQTEKFFPPNAFSEDIVPFLLYVYDEFCQENKDMKLLVLKTLANIARNSQEFATSIFTSKWLSILSEVVIQGKTLDERITAHKICQNALFSLGVLDYQLCSDIYELYIPEKVAEVDVVLIHGLRGSVGYTWRQNDASKNIETECWPKDWIPMDIQEPMRILGIDYPSYILQFTGTMESLQVRADRFKQQLTAAGIGKRPLVFICHSMGGLLAKRILLDMPELAEKTVGIMFVATPHKGSPIASWGVKDIGVSQDVIFLRETNELNKQMNEEFGSLEIPVIVSMVETKESNLIGTARGIVVPTQSAVFDKGAVYHIEEIHQNALLGVSYATTGFDAIDSITSTKYGCMKTSGYSFFIGRVYHSSGSVDTA